MPSSTATSLIDKVALQLNDTNKVRWTQAELVSYFNDAIKAVCLRRPDAYTTLENFQCAAGTRQTVPDDVYLLLDVVRNVNGKAVRGPHDRMLLDNYRPDWQSSTGQLETDVYMYDERDPDHFYVYPGVSVVATLEIVVCRIPDDQTEADVSGGSLCPLGREYDNPVMDWMIYRAFNKDAEYAANNNRAQLSLSAFKAAIGEKAQADNATFTSNQPDQKKMK